MNLLPKCRWLTSTQSVPQCQEGRQPQPWNFAVAGDTAVAAAVLRDFASGRPNAGSTCGQRLHNTALEGVWHSQALTARPSATSCVCGSGMAASCCMQGGRGSGTAGIRCSLQAQGGHSVWDGCTVWRCSCSPCRSVAAIAGTGASWSWQTASLFTAMRKSSLCAVPALEHMAPLLFSSTKQCFLLQCLRRHSCHTGERKPMSLAGSPK